MNALGLACLPLSGTLIRLPDTKCYTRVDAASETDLLSGRDTEWANLSTRETRVQLWSGQYSAPQQHRGIGSNSRAPAATGTVKRPPQALRGLA